MAQEGWMDAAAAPTPASSSAGAPVGSIANPKTAAEQDYNTYMTLLREGAKRQKEEYTERFHRMAAHAQGTEVARQLRILYGVTPNREPTADDLAGRRPGWMQQEQGGKVSRPGDRDEPTKFPGPDDVGGRRRFALQRERADADAAGRVSTTSRYKQGDTVEGSGVSGSARVAGELYPVLARPSFQFVQGDGMQNSLTGFNRSDGTAAIWREAEEVRDRRSDGLRVDLTGAPEHAGNNHSTKGNLAVQPSLTLLNDDTSRGSDNRGGGVSQVTRMAYQRGAVRVADDASLPIEQKPSFLLVAKPTAARDGSTRFRHDDENFAADLALRNKTGETHLGPRTRNDEYKFVDDGRYAVPAPANATDLMPGPAMTGRTRVKDDAVSVDAQALGLARQDGLVVLQDTGPRRGPQHRTDLRDAQLQEDLYLKSLGTGRVAEFTQDRAAAPEETRGAPERASIADLLNAAARRGEDRRGGREALDEAESSLHKQNVRMPASAAALGAHNVTVAAAPPSRPATRLTRDAPVPDRELLRAQGSSMSRRDMEKGGATRDPLAVDMLSHGQRQLQPLLSVLTERKDVVPMASAHDHRKHIGADLMSRGIGVNSKSAMHMLQAIDPLTAVAR